jgi:hypothetical protein
MFHEEIRQVPVHLEAATHRTEVAPEPRPRALDLLSGQATLLAWLLFLGLGAAFLTSYYAHIHYFPVLDWQESFSYLAAVLVLGGGVAVIYSLLLYFPGVIWSEFLISDTELEDYFCYDGTNGMEPCYWHIGKHLVIPFAAYMAAVHLAMLSNNLKVVAAVVIAGLALMLRLSWNMFQSILAAVHKRRTRAGYRDHARRRRALETDSDPPLAGGHPRTEAKREWLLLKYMMTVGLATAASGISLTFLYWLASGAEPSRWLLALCTVLVTMSNLLVAVQFRRKPRRAAVTAAMAALVLLVAAELSHPLSVTIMQRFGLGTAEGTLVVTDLGSETLSSAGFKPNDGDAAAFSRLRVLSRLGSEYLVSAGSRRATIPKTEVLSWATQE